MTHVQFKIAADLFIELVKAQPGVISPVGHGEKAGKNLAETAWGFIEEFQRRHQENVKS